MDVFSWRLHFGIEYPARASWCVTTAALLVAYCRLCFTAYHALSLSLRTRRDETTGAT